LPDSITVFPLPIASCTTDSNNVFSHHPIHFLDISTGNGINQWYWDFGDGDTSTQQSPIHAYNIEGSYQIELIVTSADGCKDTSFCEIDITEGITVPNVFTPNGDGYNDDFEITYSSSFETFSMKIYDRWGLRIFSTTDFAKRWNGLREDGKKVPDGVYFWILQGTSIVGKVYNMQGTITVIR
jgi:gliding motility-associated-like protein